MKALLSIKPEFVAKIFSGEKKFEYRKAVFANKNVRTVLIYSTMPVGEVVGEFEIDTILSDTPHDLWEKTKEFSGINKSLFHEYFEGRERAYAIRIAKTTVYDQPRMLKEVIDRSMPPQSCYV